MLFKYTLPLGLKYDLLSEDAKVQVDRQTKTVHGLPFEPFLSNHNRQEFHPYHQLRDDVSRWCQQCLTPERWRLGVFTVNGLYQLYQEPRFSYPIVVLKGQGCKELSSLPIATVNIMATNDHGQNWCQDHIHGQRGIWHDCCARVRACQMSGWLRRQSNVLQTLSPMPNACFGKIGVIVSWITSYATNALMTKTALLPKEKAWIGSPIIAVNAEPSDVSLDKPSPTENGRNALCMPMMSRTSRGLENPCLRININPDFFQFYRQRAKSLAPLTQPDLDAAMPIVTRAATFHLGSTCLPSHHPPVFTA